MHFSWLDGDVHTIVGEDGNESLDYALGLYIHQPCPFRRTFATTMHSRLCSSIDRISSQPGTHRLKVRGSFRKVHPSLRVPLESCLRAPPRQPRALSASV